MDILVELQNLKDNRLLRDDQEVEKFEKAIEDILTMKDGNHIALLCQGFDDDTENDEVMFGLIHAIESYDNIVGSVSSLSILANSFSVMLPHAQEWLKIIQKRILNHDPSRETYKKIIPTLDSDIQKVIISQLNAIKAKNASRFEQSVNSVLS
ncbi:Imm30 family immunity protein [Terribacillus saccharophilus]|uniref:Imm30 family immunity protein n=1 Tax=Terribacillus saccharophilus TaxID=361277 RepID=UPI002989F167|nr:Imm30 family immunity protein [Terribacillus saccharophilus]MCM3225739.1 Imm30 family immunity protein [Terribacillus saccharophilus]